MLWTFYCSPINVFMYGIFGIRVLDFFCGVFWLLNPVPKTPEVQNRVSVHPRKRPLCLSKFRKASILNLLKKLILICQSFELYSCLETQQKSLRFRSLLHYVVLYQCLYHYTAQCHIIVSLSTRGDNHYIIFFQTSDSTSQRDNLKELTP